ncbi:hypothetical protein NX794_34285 [Streptomyces sp. LP11]|uniref:Gram-positive cocci surface proteins LPxTG domain-containing protein n=1 Tax=Streptomyces pyxinicus TaxID=2970331 RepID=A0ABT2BE91_9ACTN|nr:hypothetical protein [Streptomyces sp. LP11]MCS0606243.1 hypothetical protein [Streptomyces sp. LP11]
MRLCPPPLSPRLAAAVATAAVTAGLGLALAPGAAAAATASCVAADARSFPLATRIRGGPARYEAGGGFGTWYLDLTNTTTATCAGIHPVVVLTDTERVLRPEQPQLEFYDGPRTRAVPFEATDEQELVGVLDGTGFDGFTVPPGRTVSVRLRLALTSDTASEQVTVNAAVVQRRGEDGDWVGESNAYRFGIDQDGPGEETPGPDGTPGPTADPTATPAPYGTPVQDGTPVPSATTGTPASPPPTGTATPDSSLFLAGEAQAAGRRARELARTGPALAHGLLAATGALLAVGAAAHLLARRRH